jgi:hypothetical protein
MHYILINLVQNLKFGITNCGGRNFLGRICVNGREVVIKDNIGWLIIFEEFVIKVA